jgi:hypothetical protein
MFPIGNAITNIFLGLFEFQSIVSVFSDGAAGVVLACAGLKWMRRKGVGLQTR